MRLSLPPPGISVILLTLVLAAAVYDVRFRRIPNWITATGVVIGLAMNAFLFQGWPGLKLSAIGMAGAFAIYFVLYAIRAMGAGDVKLMAAVGALVGWQDWFGIFLITAMLGGVMALIVAFSKKRLQRTFFNVAYIFSEMRHGRPAYVNREELDVRSPIAVGLPHGAVIAVGTVFYLAASAHFAG
jgi:prepilin peptidase CpaA